MYISICTYTYHSIQACRTTTFEMPLWASNFSRKVSNYPSWAARELLVGFFLAERGGEEKGEHQKTCWQITVPEVIQKGGQGSTKTSIYGCFLKWWYPTTIGFPTKNDHFGVFWGYHHWRKHPYGDYGNSMISCVPFLGSFFFSVQQGKLCSKELGKPTSVGWKLMDSNPPWLGLLKSSQGGS